MSAFLDILWDILKVPVKCLFWFCKVCVDLIIYFVLRGAE